MLIVDREGKGENVKLHFPKAHGQETGQDRLNCTQQIILSLKGLHNHTFPGETRRAPGMNAYSPTYTKEMLMHPLYQAICNHFLCTKNSFWWGDYRRDHISYPQVSACTAFQVGPGAKDQQIHRVSPREFPSRPSAQVH